MHLHSKRNQVFSSGHAQSQVLKQLIIGCLAYLVSLLSNIFFSHVMDTRLYGDFRLSLGLLGIATTLCLLGTDTATNRFVSKMYHEHDFESITKYFVWNRKLVKRNFKICFLLSSGLIIASIILHFLGYKKINEYSLSFYSLWLAPIAALTTLFSSYMVSSDQVCKGSFYQLVASNLLIFLYFLIPIYILGSRANNDFLIFIILACSYITALILEIISLKNSLFSPVRKIINHVTSESAPTRKLWLSSAIRFITGQLLFNLFNYLDLLMIKLFSPHRNLDTALYSAITIIIQILFILPNALVFLVKLSVSESSDQPKEHEKIQKIINVTNLILFATLSCLLLIIIYYHVTILGWFGREFTQASSALVIFAIGLSIQGFLRISRTILAYSGHENTLLYTGAASIVIAILLGIPASHYFGVEGMSAVMAFLCVAQGITFFILAKRFFPNIKPISFF